MEIVQVVTLRGIKESCSPAVNLSLDLTTQISTSHQANILLYKNKQNCTNNLSSQIKHKNIYSKEVSTTSLSHSSIAKETTKSSSYLSILKDTNESSKKPEPQWLSACADTPPARPTPTPSTTQREPPPRRVGKSHQRLSSPSCTSPAGI